MINATNGDCSVVQIDAFEKYKIIWSAKTTKQIKKELESWQKYMRKHSGAYDWHGKWMTPPDHLADGDKVLALRLILEERIVNEKKN